MSSTNDNQQTPSKHQFCLPGYHLLWFSVSALKCPINEAISGGTGAVAVRLGGSVVSRPESFRTKGQRVKINQKRLNLWRLANAKCCEIGKVLLRVQASYRQRLTERQCSTMQKKSASLISFPVVWFPIQIIANLLRATLKMGIRNICSGFTGDWNKSKWTKIYSTVLKMKRW